MTTFTRKIFGALQASRLWMLVIGWTLSTTIAQAQAPLGFVHGLNSSASTWGTFPSDIAASVSVTGRAVNLSPSSYYESQASQFGAALPGLFDQGPLGNLIAVGHSNGGIVSREFAKTRPIRGLITIGSPHRGAHLATATVQNYLIPFLQTWISDIVSPINEYLGLLLRDDGCPLLCFGAYNRLRIFANAIESGVNFAGFAVAAGAQFTVLGQMDVWSGYQQTLNSSGTLATESNNIPRRIAIVSEANPGNISMWKGVVPGSAGTLSGMTRSMALLYAGLYEYYATYTDYNDPWMWLARQDAWKWAWGSTQLFNIEYYWCNLMGGDWNGQCHGDGIVSTTSQQWPGSNRTIPLSNGPGHIQETQDPLVRQAVISALQTSGFVFTP